MTIPMMGSATALENLRRNLVALRMPRALEMLSDILLKLERGELSAIEAIDLLLAEELALRQGRRIVDEIGYLPVTPGGGNLFFQLVNARYEKGAMILTSNRGFAEWGEVFGDPVVATALLDRLLHHAVVIQIDGASYRLRSHADLTKDRAPPRPVPPQPPRPRGRPPKNRTN